MVGAPDPIRNKSIYQNIILVKKYLILSVLIIGLAIALKTFVFSVFQVISASMGPTLLIGDRILIKKSIKSDDNNKKSGICPGEIIVFKPVDTTMLAKSKYVKRCVGKPGDTIEIINGYLKRNGKYVEKLNSIYKKDYNITDESDYRIQFLKKKMLFPGNKAFNFTLLNFGPVIIPQKGMKIVLNPKNKILYGPVIKRERGTISGCKAVSKQKGYCFKQNYYFVIGDNYFSSIDSRFWGFLPEENIAGRALLILYSFEKKRQGLKRLRLDRLFKRSDFYIE